MTPRTAQSSTWPDNWTWRQGPVDPRGAVVVDIDGVLSDAASRQHYIEAPRPDWRAFFDACGADPLIEEVKILLDLLAPEMQVVLLTARPERVHQLTEAWLGHYGIRWDVLIMRGWGDYAAAREFKRQTVEELRAYGFALALAFEDDRRNVEMFHDEGVPCLYVHSGYYD